MQTDIVTDIAARLEQLEKSNRRLQLVLSAVVVAVASFALSTVARQEPTTIPNEVVARRLRIVDERGETYVTLSAVQELSSGITRKGGELRLLKGIMPEAWVRMSCSEESGAQLSLCPPINSDAPYVENLRTLQRVELSVASAAFIEQWRSATKANGWKADEFPISRVSVGSSVHPVSLLMTDQGSSELNLSVGRLGVRGNIRMRADVDDRSSLYVTGRGGYGGFTAGPAGVELSLNEDDQSVRMNVSKKTGGGASLFLNGSEKGSGVQLFSGSKGEAAIGFYPVSLASWKDEGRSIFGTKADGSGYMEIGDGGRTRIKLCPNESPRSVMSTPSIWLFDSDGKTLDRIPR